jgi:hypothetical protein
MRKNGEILILMLYVDDIFLTGSSVSLISWIKDNLQRQFKMTDLGKVKRYFGISFETVPLGIFIHQRDYAASILRDFGMANCKSAYIPLPEGLILVSDMKTLDIDPTYYCQLVGKLIFLTITRPDLSYAVSRISSYMSQPQQAHLDAAKHILRYIKHTLDYGILYKANLPLILSGYADADWGSCPETRRSMGAYIFTLANGPISWQSKRQHTISRSSTESEYRALSDCTQEVVYLHRLLTELDIMPPDHSSSLSADPASPTPPSFKVHLYCDNQGALKLAHNLVFHA